MRLLAVLEKQPEGRAWITGHYSVADIAIAPWLCGLESYGVRDLAGWDDLPNVKAHLGRHLARPAVHKGLNIPPREV